MITGCNLKWSGIVILAQKGIMQSKIPKQLAEYTDTQGLGGPDFVFLPSFPTW